MSLPPTWSDKQHEERDLAIRLPVSVALQLQRSLPLLLRAMEERGPRNPEDRDQYRAASATLEILLEQLAVSLRPYDVPRTAASQPDGEVG